MIKWAVSTQGNNLQTWPHWRVMLLTNSNYNAASSGGRTDNAANEIVFHLSWRMPDANQKVQKLLNFSQPKSTTKSSSQDCEQVQLAFSYVHRVREEITMQERACRYRMTLERTAH